VHVPVEPKRSEKEGAREAGYRDTDNMRTIAENMVDSCEGDHSHSRRWEEFKAASGRYTEDLCDEMLKAIDMHVKYKNEKLANICMNLGELNDMCEAEMVCAESGRDEFDDVTGEVLDGKLVQEAMLEELKMFKDMGVYE